MNKHSIGGIICGLGLALSLRRYFPTKFAYISFYRSLYDITLPLLGLSIMSNIACT